MKGSCDNMTTLYVSDLDGTLLNTNSKLSEDSIGIINKLIGQGMKFTYATARSYSSASKVVEGIDFKIPAITYNGAFFIEPKDGRIIESTSFSAQQIKYISEILIDNKMNPLVYSIINDEERVSWIEGFENEGMLYYLKLRTGDKRLRAISKLEELYVGLIFYFTVIGEKDELEKIRVYFNDSSNFICTVQQELYREEYWLEIMPKDATKANGIEKLKKIIGCDKVVCFGDAINDISMFMIADEAYAVENADLELKKIATGIIESNDNYGVAKWLLDNVI